jgi:Ca2+/Na+ antiporter
MLQIIFKTTITDLSFLHLKSKFYSMKKIFILIMIVAFVVAFYVPKGEKYSVIVMAIAVVIFMFGMMKLSSKLPSKNEDEDDENI